MSMQQLLNISTARKFLIEDPILKTYRRIFEERGLPVERRSELLDLTNAIIDGALPPADASAIIESAFGLDEEKAKQLTCDVLGYGVLPLEKFIPGIPEAITALGGEVEKYPAVRVEKDRVSAFAWSERLQKEANIQFSDVLTKRLALLLEGRMKGEKNAESLRTYFGRSLTIGGLALLKEQIDALATAIEGEAPFVELVSDEEWKKMQEPAPVVEGFDDAKPVRAGEIEIPPGHELAAEVPVLEWRGRTDARLAEAVEACVESAKPILLDKNIALPKFRDLAEKNIRGVRDPGKTRDILEKEYALSGADLRVVLDALSAGKKKYDGEKRPAEDGEGKEEGEGTVELRESDAMDAKFLALTKTTPTESIAPIMPGSRVSAAREAGTATVKMLRPKPAKAELTVGSVSPTSPERKVTDVVQASRLMGPAEQLKNMSPLVFRRMSSDPAEAAQKIDDLLSSLAVGGYEDKVHGIKAWRESPMNQLYLTIAEEALGAGLSVPEVASRRRKEGKDSLSPAEIKALVSLNAKLRF
ncbi:MAG: hypothetical protein WC802_02150 [Patescibacteria group bacterium]|jgi:hypothetical protein